MTGNGLIQLKQLVLSQSKYSMCINIYATLHSFYYNKNIFQIFTELVQKTMKMRKCHLVLVNCVSMLSDC